MNFDRSGIILYVIDYPACVAFYRDILELPIMFRTEELTCFEFGSSYLMVELDTDHLTSPTSIPARDRLCLRMNVPDVKMLADRLKAKQVEVSYQEHSWGTIAKFRDPDGNLCAFKDSEKFEKQIQDHR